MLDLMIDLETMGRRADAAIVSIGAVFFDEHTGQLGREFYRAINLATAVENGGTMDPGTVMFWLGQPDEARNAIRFSTYHIHEALTDFLAFVEQEKATSYLRVWGNSPRFDCEKLDNALRGCGYSAPWKYYNERCYRTIRERAKWVDEDERIGLHNALDDAKHQANHLIKIRRMANVRNEATKASGSGITG